MRDCIFCLFLLAFISCTSPRDKSIAEVTSSLELVNKSFAVNRIDTDAIRKAESGIGAFIQKYPQDTLASAYLFELGMLYQKQRKFEQAVNVFDKVYREYADSKQASKAVFLQGFLYANVLNDFDKGKEKYQLYLDKYSGVDEKITYDVQLELKNMGKSPDELLKEIQAREDSLGQRQQ